MFRVACLFVAMLGGCLSDTALYPLRDTSQLITTNEGRTHRWSHLDFPIWVIIDNTMNPEYQEASLGSVSGWNNVLGFQALLSVSSEGNPDLLSSPPEGSITVQEEECGISDLKVRLYGSAFNTLARRGRGRIRNSNISLDFGIPAEVQIPVIMHELGHALGLQHDTTHPESIMFPSINETFCQFIQEEDLEAIRQQNLL